MRPKLSETLRAVFVVISLTGCNQPKADAPASAEVNAVEPAPAAEPTPAPDPDPKPKPTPDPEAVAKAAGGEGFSVGPKPKLTPLEDADPDTVTASLSLAGAKVSASAHADYRDEYEYTTALQVRIEFGELGLNYLGSGGDDYCDELVAQVQEIAKLDDGRWLVDAQLACRAGEDYFSATNEHNLILIDPERPHAELLWTGNDSGSDAMGVCSSSSVHSFELDGSVLVIHKTEATYLNRQSAENPAVAEGCKPSPEKDEVVARLELSPAEVVGATPTGDGPGEGAQ